MRKSLSLLAFGVGLLCFIGVALGAPPTPSLNVADAMAELGCTPPMDANCRVLAQLLFAYDQSASDLQHALDALGDIQEEIKRQLESLNTPELLQERLQLVLQRQNASLQIMSNILKVIADVQSEIIQHIK